VSRIDPQQLPGRPCSVAAALELVGDRWSLLVIRELVFGNTRFSDLVRNIGAPRDRLAARLRSLVEAGIVERRQYSESPPRWDYHLTPAGWALRPVLQALRIWGDEWAVTEPPPYDPRMVSRLAPEAEPSRVEASRVEAARVEASGRSHRKAAAEKR
jgi:DNA-binding HxlR family transcriptional regulator